MTLEPLIERYDRVYLKYQRECSIVLRVHGDTCGRQSYLVEAGEQHKQYWLPRRQLLLLKAKPNRDQL